MYNRFIQIAPGLPRKYAENTVIFSKISVVFARKDGGLNKNHRPWGTKW